MKKTEKIEIRLSHEDKERLNKIAEREGRTISQIVRGLIDRYMDLNSPSGVKRFSIKDKLIWDVLGATGGAFLVTPFLVKKAPGKVIHLAKKEISVIAFPVAGGSVNGEIDFPLIDGFSGSVKLSLPSAIHHKVNLTVNEVAHDHYEVLIETCILNQGNCDIAGNKKMIITTTGTSSSSFYDKNENRYDVFISTNK